MTSRTTEEELQRERSRREVLEKLVVNERLHAQTALVMSVEHMRIFLDYDLGNGLDAVSLYLHLLERAPQGRSTIAEEEISEEERREIVQEASQCMDDVRRRVAKFRCASRLSGGMTASGCSLTEVVRVAVWIAPWRFSRVRLRVEVPEELPQVSAIFQRLAQVLLSLLVNAWEALEPHQASQKEIRVVGRSEGSTVLLLVEDNGPGFSPEVLPRIFERFFTTKNPEKSVGLGLALAREFVEEAGGTLSAENRPEGGARLRITLPAL